MTDERPKPKYGELAPEGWVWNPPQEATPNPAPEAPKTPAPVSRPVDQRSAVDQRWPAPDARAVRPTEGDPASPTPAAGAGAGTTPGRGLAVDVNITIVLLVLGTLSVGSTVATLLDLNGYMTTAGAPFGLNAYPPSELTRVTGVTGAVLHVLLLGITVWWSIRRIRTQKLAFFIPLSAAVLSLLITCVCVAVAFAQAPELFDSLSTIPTSRP